MNNVYEYKLSQYFKPKAPVIGPIVGHSRGKGLILYRTYIEENRKNILTKLLVILIEMWYYHKNVSEN